MEEVSGQRKHAAIYAPSPPKTSNDVLHRNFPPKMKFSITKCIFQNISFALPNPCKLLSSPISSDFHG